MITQKLKKLVNFYPQSNIQQNVRQLCEYFGNELSELGLESEMLNYNGVTSLYSSTLGSKHCRLLLQAHIDVVPAHNQPFSKRGDKLYGRGVYDMLFAAACYLELLEDLRDVLPELDLGIMLSGDEEIGGFDGVKSFLDDRYSADVCILPDAGDGFGGLNIGAKGMVALDLCVKGRAHHGSRPWEGDGAGAKLVKFLSDAEKIFEYSDRNNSTMTIAKIQAGDADNRGPSEAFCTLDIRYKDKTDLSRIRTELKKLYTEYNASEVNIIEGSDYQLDLSNGYVKKFIELYEARIGHKLRMTKAHGSSDARFFAEQNIPVIMLRPNGGGAHGDEEWISDSSINDFYSLLKEYVLQVALIKQ